MAFFGSGPLRRALPPPAVLIGLALPPGVLRAVDMVLGDLGFAVGEMPDILGFDDDSGRFALLADDSDLGFHEFGVFELMEVDVVLCQEVDELLF